MQRVYRHFWGALGDEDYEIQSSACPTILWHLGWLFNPSAVRWCHWCHPKMIQKPTYCAMNDMVICRYARTSSVLFGWRNAMIKKTRCECPECKFESDMIPYHTVIFCRLECTLPTHFFSYLNFVIRFFPAISLNHGPSLVLSWWISFHPRTVELGQRLWPYWPRRNLSHLDRFIP